MRKIIFTIVGILLVFPIYYLVVKYFYPDIAASGQFGDMFGTVNALFSGLAFLGVIYAIVLQREELQLQRKELELTRKELTRSAEAQENSEKALLKQAASLKVTAKLNGKSAILQHHNTLIELTNSARYGVDANQFRAHKEDADRIIEEIERLIENK